VSPRRAAVLRTDAAEPDTTLRDHLVVATGQLLEQRPLGDITTRAIAEHAGVSDGVLYNHFADKTELLMAALLRRYERLVGQLEAASPTAGQGTVLANVQRFGRALADLEADALLHGAALLAQPTLLRAFWTEIHRSPLGLDRLRRPLVEYLTAEQGLGRVSAELDIGAAVTVVFGACAMSALSRRLNPTADRATLAAELDAMLSTVVTGLGTGTTLR
jgi:AcrR family transcriptional regulator